MMDNAHSNDLDQDSATLREESGSPEGENDIRQPTMLPDGRCMCPYCGKIFANMKSFQRHRRDIHRIVEKI